jgi:hypothetical protein
MAETVPVLEQAAQEFADATAKPPFLFDYAPEEGRKIVDSVQRLIIRRSWVRRERPGGTAATASTCNAGSWIRTLRRTVHNPATPRDAEAGRDRCLPRRGHPEQSRLPAISRQRDGGQRAHCDLLGEPDT